MKKSDLFKQQRKQKRDRLVEMQTAAENENRDYNETEETEIQQLIEEIRSLDSKITMHEQMEEQVRAASAAGGPLGTPLSEGDKKDMRKFSFLKVLRSANEGAQLDGIEAEMQQEGRKELKEAGLAYESRAIQIPMVLLNQRFAPPAQQRAMTVGTDTAGGFTVETAIDGYVEALRERVILMTNGADMMAGLVGNISMPRENVVFNPSWEGEVEATDEKNPTFTNVSFQPKRLSGYVDLSNQLLIQNSSSVEARVMRQIIQGHAIALDKAGFNGSGTGQPLGIINDGDVTIIDIGENGGAVTDDILLQMEEAVDLSNGDLIPALYAVTPKIRRKLKSTKLDDGSGLFLWDRITNQVNSYKAVSTNNLPASLSKGTGTNLNAMIFGDLSACAYGMWGGLEILRESITQATKGTTRIVLNAYNDFHVLQPGALVGCKDVSVS